MATLAYPCHVRNSNNVSTDNRMTGLTPTVSDGKTWAVSPVTVTALGNVVIVEIIAGDYIALYDAEAHGDASFPVDWGAAVPNVNDRYQTLALCRDPGRVLAGFGASGQLAPGALDLPTLTPGLLGGLTWRLVLTGVTAPVTADTYLIGGVDASGNRYYKSSTLGAAAYLWNNGAGYTLSAAVGVNGSSYWTTAGAANGTYAAQGAATGVPTVTFKGGVMLDATQLAPTATTAQLVSAIFTDTTTGDLSGAPAGSPGKILSTLGANYTAARAAFLDNLNAGGVVASHADILSLNTATGRAVAISADQYPKPASGTQAYPVKLVVTNLEGVPTDVDGGGLGVAGIAASVRNAAGADRSANFAAFTHTGAGEYDSTYAVSSSATDEPIVMRFSGTVGGQAWVAVVQTVVADAFALAFNSTDRTTLNALAAGVNVTSVAGTTVGGLATSADMAAALLRDTAGADLATAPVGSPGHTLYLLAGTFVTDTPVFSGPALANTPGISGDPLATDVATGGYTGTQAGAILRSIANAPVMAMDSANHPLVVLHTNQPLFTPARPGDPMTLTGAYDAAKGAMQAGSQVSLSPSGLDAVVIEAGVNARQALSPILAASAGVLLGAGSGTVVIKGGGVGVTRITAATDNAGNRTSITLTLPA